MTAYERDDAARRMGFAGGMFRADDVLRDRRRASEQDHPSRRTNGTGGVENMSPLPRHLSVPTVGDDKSRPGVRSRRRRDDTVAAQDGQEMNVHQIAGFHREACIETYKKHGRINSRLWCESHDWFAIIDPTVWEALDIKDWDRTEMLLASVQAIGGHIVGRCDEMLFRFGWNIGNPKREESLEELRDIDPSIRSALVVHALDGRTTESYMTLATVDLDEDGLPYWERHEGQYSIPMMVSLWGVARELREARKEPPVAFEDAERVCAKHGWLVTFLNKWEHGIA